MECSMTCSKKSAQYGTDLLLLLLYARGSSSQINEPIGGITRLQKELFLLQKILQDEGIEYKYPLRPYQMGPFSRELYRDIEWLKSENIIEEKRPYFKNKGIRRVFKLTQEGRKEVSNLARNPNTFRMLKVVEQVKKRYNGMNLFDLVEFTHRAFPEYVKKRARNRKLGIPGKQDSWHHV